MKNEPKRNTTLRLDVSLKEAATTHGTARHAPVAHHARRSSSRGVYTPPHGQRFRIEGDIGIRVPTRNQLV